MKKSKELVELESRLKHLKSISDRNSYTAREIEETKQEIRELKKNKDGKQLKFAYFVQIQYNIRQPTVYEVILIPRKFSNSKGKNFYSEIKETKKLNRLFREVRAMQKIKEEELKKAKNHKG